MDRWQAIYDFWSKFGIPAYEENSVPEDAEFPYITFESAVGEFESIVTLSASIWDRTKSGTAFIDNLSDEIAYYIKNIQKCPRVIGGRYRVFISDVTPFAQNMGDPEDKLIKRKILNVNFEFMTT